MITIESKLNDINTFFNTLRNELGGTLTSNPTEFTLHLDSSLGSGTIRSIILDEGISVLEFNLNVNQDIKIAIDSHLGTYVNFSYCSKGKLSHTFGNEGTINTIETFQTSILSNITSSRNTILVEKDVRTIATVISINTRYENSNQSYWNSSLRNLFITEKQEDYLYVGSYNLTIAENIKQLQAIQQEGLVRALLTKGIVNVILALEIEQHNKDIANSDMSSISLSQSEFVLIQELSDDINTNPDLDHKVEILTRKVGLSAAKIQEGFKFKHGMTVCEYIRYVRLIKSEILISTSDLTISEIVYSLGLTSRSYFSKIFKERFDCTPSEYKRKNKLAVSA